MAEPSQETYLVIAPEDARFWAESNRGNVRGEIWADALKRASRITATGGSCEIRWWKQSARPSEHGGGSLEVIRTRKRQAPPKRTRRRMTDD